jgi:hypothetical protein
MQFHKLAAQDCWRSRKGRSPEAPTIPEAVRGDPSRSPQRNVAISSKIVDDQLGDACTIHATWGLSNDGTELIFSDGSPVDLLCRPRTFAIRNATVLVRVRAVVLWSGIWKRFHMFTTDDPELARSPDGGWNSLAWSPKLR